MGGLAKTAKALGQDIAGIGKWILRLGEGALVGLGAGAILGGFGLSELAGAAFSRSRTASGLGLTPGQLASFQVNAQPYLGPGALQSAASAQLSYASAPYLQMLGIDFRRAQNMNAADGIAALQSEGYDVQINWGGGRTDDALSQCRISGVDGLRTTTTVTPGTSVYVTVVC